MGKVKQLWQDQRERESQAVWQQAYDDYCRDQFGGAEPVGRDHDAASEAADEAVAEFEQERDEREFEPDPDRLRDDQLERQRLEKEYPSDE